MDRVTTFDSTKEALLDLLRSIRDGSHKGVHQSAYVRSHHKERQLWQ